MKPLITGAGPVGMLLAILLAQHGIRCQLIDKRPARSPLPRGIAINQQTLAILQQAGLLERTLAAGIQVPRLNLYRGTRPFAAVSFDASSLQHPYFFHIRQCDLEQLLAQRLAELGVEVLYRHTLVALEQQALHAAATVGFNASLRTIECDYVLGCDGGASTCCELAGIPVARQAYGGHFRLADVTFGSVDWARNETHYYLGERGYLMLIPAPNGETRVIASYPQPPSGSEALLRATDIERLVHQRSGHTAAITQLRWSTQAPFGHRIAAQAVKGRVMLAGDALHQFSPIGGTNMNVGIADASALASALINGTTQAYATERLAVVKQQVAATRYLTRVMVKPQGMALPERPFTSRTLHDLLYSELPQLLTGFSAPGVQPAQGVPA